MNDRWTKQIDTDKREIGSSGENKKKGNQGTNCGEKSEEG